MNKHKGRAPKWDPPVGCWQNLDTASAGGVRGQSKFPLLPPCGFREQVWWQLPLPTVPHCQLTGLFLRGEKT